MIALLARKRDEIAGLCREFQVKRLDLFGSAATGAFDPASSDLDFAVAFAQMAPASHADCYFGLLHALEDAFGCRVDLVEMTAVRNPYVLASIDASRELLYAA